MKEQNYSNKNTTNIYFAGGCFWGTEHFFKQIRGVLATEVGYANGNLSQAPSYRQVCVGDTGFAETVKVTYDPQLINLNQLLDLYFKIIDPTSLNKQGNDHGTQYRTGIYYINESEKPLIEKDYCHSGKTILPTYSGRGTSAKKISTKPKSITKII